MYGRFLVIFALIFTGYMLAKKKIFEDEATFAINRFIVYFACPCMIVQKISALEMDNRTFKDFMLMLVLSTVLMCAGYLVCYMYSKLRKFPREIANVAELSMNSPNNGFMGFPIALLFFGDIGLLFMLAHNAALNLYLFSLGSIVMRRNKTEGRKMSARQFAMFAAKVITNPNIVATLAGLIICGLNLHLPEALGEYFSYVGNITIPMALIYIGTTLTKSKLGDILKNVRVIECSVVKLALIPGLSALAVAFLPVSTIIKATCVLGASFPSAAFVPMLAQQEEQNAQFSCEVLFLSTLLSAVTIPVWVQLINIMF